jgi:hypothetical protein
MARTMRTSIPTLLDMDLQELGEWFQECQDFEEAQAKAVPSA